MIRRLVQKMRKYLLSDLTYVIPAKNASQWVERCVTSLLNGGAHYTNIIVVDDHSTDNTLELAISLGVVALSSPGQGACAARNYGLTQVSHGLVCFIDADDYVIGPHYSNVISEYDGKSDLALGLFGATRENTIDLYQFNKFSSYEDPMQLIASWFGDVGGLQTGQVIYSADFAKSVGGWNENLSCYQDYEFNVRCLLRARSVQALTKWSWAVWDRHCNTGQSVTTITNRRNNSWADGVVLYNVFLYSMGQKHPNLCEHFDPAICMAVCSLTDLGYQKQAFEIIDQTGLQKLTLQNNAPLEAFSSIVGVKLALLIRANFKTRLGNSFRAVRDFMKEVFK